MLKRSLLMLMLIVSTWVSVSAQGQNDDVATIIQRGHKNRIYSVSHSPDGKNFATYSTLEGTTMIWSKLGQLVKIFPMTYQESIEYTPDGKFLIGRDEVFDLNGKLVIDLAPGRYNGVSCSSVSPDGKLVALGLDNVNDPDKRKIRIVDREGKTVRLINGTNHMPKRIAFSPDGKLLAVGAGSLNELPYVVGEQEPFDPTCELVLMTVEGEILHTQKVEADVTKIGFSPDGKRIVASLYNGQIVYWNTDGTLIQETEERSTGKGVAFSADGRFSVLYGNYGISVFDAQANLLRKFRDDTEGNVSADNCSISPDGRYIVTYRDSDMYLWDNNGTLVKKIPSAFSADGFNDVGFVENTNFFYSGNVLWSFDGKRIQLPSPNFSFLFCQDGKTIVASQFIRNGNKVSYNTSVIDYQGNVRAKIPGVKGVRIDNNTIITAKGSTYRTMLGVYNLDGKLIDSVFSGINLVYSTDKKYHITSSYKGVDLFETSSPTKLASLYNNDSSAISEKEFYRIQGAFFSPDGNVLLKHRATGVELFEVPSGKRMAEIRMMLPGYSSDVYDGAVTSMATSTKNKKIFFSNDSRKVFHLGLIEFKAYDLNGNTIQTGADLSALRGASPEIAVSADEKYLFGYFYSKVIAKISMTDGRIMTRSRVLDSEVYQMRVTPDGKKLLTLDSNGNLRLWDVETLEEVASFYALGESDYSIVTRDGYYAASKNAGRYMHFSKDFKTFTFDNFDLIYNRPDIIVERLGLSDEELKTGLRKAYLKRLQKMGFTEEQVSLDFHLPEIEIQTRDLPDVTDQKFITVSVKATDSKFKLDRLNVYVNDVPLFGVKGLTLKELNISEVIKDIKIELTNGRNMIQFATMNDKGAESIKETIEVSYNGPSVKPVLYVVAIGVSDYANNEFDLKYASKDASDLVALMVANKAKFADVKVVKVTDLLATKANIRKAKETLKLSRVDDQVVLFAAGHGLLDNDLNFYFATTDIDFNNPVLAGLPYEDLEGLLDDIPARRKLMLIDACHSGEVDKDETVITSSTKKASGGTVASRGFKTVAKKEGAGLKNSFELMQELFSDLRKGTGAIIISSASGVEFAFESDAWKNGVFTYSVLEGLKTGGADSNKDTSVDVSELRDYVIKKVAELTNGKQHPTSRKESLEFDFKVW